MLRKPDADRNITIKDSSPDADCVVHGNVCSNRTDTNSRTVTALARTSEILGSSSRHTGLSHGDYTYFLNGQIGKIGPVCCATISQISEDCWPKMFPINPFFPPLLKITFAAPSPTLAEATTMSKVSFPRITNVTEIIECWSSLADIEGCVLEIYQSILNTGLIGKIGPTCCKAVTEINDKCWPKIFPFNLFFPPLLKSTCSTDSSNCTTTNFRLIEMINKLQEQILT
ncbi:hypothetical protein Ddye_007883 [Dipteronia dyeriana]|uniref:Prolamin-like domain-containing protein n=1 Tax=Dipteronia dyeriana TaxID=168575 RepID=A0AAD9XKV5_9ROSI|nr:hypothetical protein Ddye_007883 [Dipteronia dyeriana]